ncbi:glycosyltransferase family 32 protein [Amanita muscaria]
MATSNSFTSPSSSSRSRARIHPQNSLPLHSPYRDSHVRQHPIRRFPWWFKLLFSILRSLWACLIVLRPLKFYQFTASLCGRKRAFSFVCTLYLALILAAYALAYRAASPTNEWPPIFSSSTLVYKREDLQRIWKWEIASGHYPSRRQIPEQIHLRSPPINPALPPPRHASHKQPYPYVTGSRGTGAERVYQDLHSPPQNVAYPPRPPPGSVIDMDVVMEHCDFSHDKFVRDCLEVLRVGAGLDSGKRVRRGNMDNWNYIYLEKGEVKNSTLLVDTKRDSGEYSRFGSDGLSKKRGAEWEEPPIQLPEPRQYQPYSKLPSPCDPENLRVFHMFWTGPFTDKPYLALLSFLYTQNTGLHQQSWPDDSPSCRPKVWLWINPGPAAAVPNANAEADMLKELSASPWATPFLHPRFKDLIEFKLWNTTEQLDSIPELRDEWRKRDLFFSNGRAIAVPPKIQQGLGQEQDFEELAHDKEGENADDMLHRKGSKSSSTYDRLSVILSDMARFILCHRYGGIYLDADTVFLRDWEEVWGWHGAFSYRWSRLPRYNTAVLHLNKGSALGTFLFKTALKNGLDFHPDQVSRYTRDAYLENLLLRVPDALFDPAWLVSEGYQSHRPPQPYFTSFQDFFDTPMSDGAAPQTMGFDGFFRGAYSYHYHNFWWKPSDPARNWPDLGPQFNESERIAREKANAYFEGEGRVEDDKRDLDWGTVIKRTCEAYIRGDIPNLYGEWLVW